MPSYKAEERHIVAGTVLTYARAAAHIALAVAVVLAAVKYLT